MASLVIAGVADIDYSVADGRVRSFELNGRLLFDESQGIEISGWREQLYQVVLDYSLDVDKGRGGLHAFVPPIVEEFQLKFKARTLPAPAGARAVDRR